MTDSEVRPLGELIRMHRTLSQMSLRRLAQLSAVSNPYLSQIERGLHEPSFRVLQSVADALDVSAESLLRQAGMLRGPEPDASGPAPDPDAASGPDACAPASSSTFATAPAPAPAPAPASTSTSSASSTSAVEDAIAADPRLDPAQRSALISVYRSYVGSAPVRDLSGYDHRNRSRGR